MPDEMRTPDAGTPPVPPPQQQFTTSTSEISTVYTNFCRVNLTPEELILDFGLNTQMVPNASETIKLSHRVVMNFYTAKQIGRASCRERV